MAWSRDWSASVSGVDIQDADVINEFYGAAEERRIAARTVGATAEQSVGDVWCPESTASNFWIRIMQGYIDDLCSDAVVAFDGGVKRSTNYWNNGTTSPYNDTYGDVAGLMSALGLSYSGFRRKERGAGSFSYGGYTEDDEIGPWLFEDLYRCLNGLIWFKNSSVIVDGESWYGDGNGATTSDAKSAAESDYQKIGTSSSNTAYCQSYFYGSGSTYTAILEVIGGNLSVEYFLPGFDISVDWWVLAVETMAGADFDANGDTLIKDRWCLSATDDFDSDATEIVSSNVMPGILGSTHPAWGSLGTRLGYKTSSRCSVVRCEGGFEYA